MPGCLWTYSRVNAAELGTVVDYNELMKTRYAALYQLEGTIADGTFHFNNRRVKRSFYEINCLKRATSYLHGALIAIRYIVTAADDHKQQHELAQKVIALFESAEGNLNSVREVRKFILRLGLLLEPYGITYSDLKAGESIANIERKKLMEINAIQSGDVTETLLNADLGDSYAFITQPEAGLKDRKALLRGLRAVGDDHKNEQARAYNDYANALRKAPKWFLSQNRIMQVYLIDHAKEKDFPAMPSTLRGVPGLPNATVHRCQNDAFDYTVIRHGTLTPYEMTSFGERADAARENGLALAKHLQNEANARAKVFYTKEFASKMESLPVAEISFLSPHHGEGSIGTFKNKSKHTINSALSPAYRAGYVPLEETDLTEDSMNARFSETRTRRDCDRAVRQENRLAYEWGVQENPSQHGQKPLKPYWLNMGINELRWITSKTFNKNENIRAFTRLENDFQAFEILVNENGGGGVCFKPGAPQRHYHAAIGANAQLIAMRNRFNGHFMLADAETRDLHNRINAELMADCYYAMVIQGMGGVVSASCKSGKDRTGLFLLHLDALYEYHRQYGEIYPFDAAADSDARKNFVNIMRDLYLNNTQQYMAGQNTYGSSGLKSPTGVGGRNIYPPDLRAAIEAKSPGTFHAQKKLASMNKLEPGYLESVKERFNRWFIWAKEKVQAAFSRLCCC